MIVALLAILLLIGCTTFLLLRPGGPYQVRTAATGTARANFWLTLTAVPPTLTARAKARVATTATAKAEAAAEATAVAATANAPLVAASITAAVPKVTARVRRATELAAELDPICTARAVSAEATATSAGLLISAPEEVKWRWDGAMHKWMWDIEFKEVAGRAITITTQGADFYDVEGWHYVSGRYLVDIAVAAYGRGVDHYWFSNAVEGLFHDGTCVLTYKVIDERGSEFSVQAVTRLKDEEE